ncbi:IS630 family transposase [Zavarzinella formosa]|uniref:IS630 family transposase n=1 Tax=Zavarzinella formosa TaxID=360055 RepID=UPI0003775284|nr:IS630 family transposase [Zavarzinella formosa]
METQAVFRREQLEPALAEAAAGRRDVYFVDAAHFVRGAFLCCVWCAARLFIRGASGRQRHNVLGAWNAITRQPIRISNTTRVSSDTMTELLAKIAAGMTRPVTLVLDNARYQHCRQVKEEAARHGIQLLFLPSYSPNLNLIERVWKFTKSKALRGRHHKDFQVFQQAIDDCLDRTATDHADKMKSLMTLSFQSFDEASFLAA